MKTKKILTTIIMLAAVMMASAQIRIPETKVSFSFPNGGWKYLETSKINDNTNVYLYSYSKDYVVDNAGDTVIPFMRIYVRKNYTGTVYDMAYSRFMAQGFQALQEYPFLDGIGYLGAYTNDGDGKDYEFKMVYIKDRNIMLEIRLETTLDLYDNFDKEFQAILETIKVSK